MTPTEMLQTFLARAGLYNRAVDDVHGAITARAAREALARHLAEQDAGWSDETWDDEPDTPEEAQRRDGVREQRFAALRTARAAVASLDDDAVTAQITPLVEAYAEEIAGA
jgi:hypothetical protein